MAIDRRLIAVATYTAIRLAASRPVNAGGAFVGAFVIGRVAVRRSKMGHYHVAAFYLLPLR